jgi:hypothetical protein
MRWWRRDQTRSDPVPEWVGEKSDWYSLRTSGVTLTVILRCCEEMLTASCGDDRYGSAVQQMAGPSYVPKPFCDGR